MGDALIELELTIRSSKENLTPKEVDILRTCKANGIRGFTIGASVAYGLVWTATRRLSYAHRFVCSGGAAAVCGMWNCDRSLNSCLDHILSMEGSRMQTVLAHLLLRNHRDNPRRLLLVQKHFYPEKVFDDSNIDHPLSRWRNRNFFVENVDERIHDHSYTDKPDLEPEQFTRTPDEDVIVDPLECILGYAKPSDDLQNSASTSNSLRRRHVHHKRAHRRHRNRHLDDSLSHATRQQYATT